MARENTLRTPDPHDQSNVDQFYERDLLGADDGLAGKATNFEAKRDTAKNDASFAQSDPSMLERGRKALEEEVREQAHRQALSRTQTKLKQQQMRSLGTKVAKAAGLARVGTIGVAWTLWFWQFVCAAVSLIGIGFWATISETVNSSFLGRAANWALSLGGSSIEKLIPADIFALTFWGLATIIALSSFILFVIVFRLTSTPVFDTLISALITTLAFSLSLMPVTNLFPWIPLWVMYVTALSAIDMIQPTLTKGSAMGGV